MNICLNYFDVFGVLFNEFNKKLNKTLFLFGINKPKNRFSRVQKSVENSLLCSFRVQFLNFSKHYNLLITNVLPLFSCPVFAICTRKTGAGLKINNYKKKFPFFC